MICSKCDREFVSGQGARVLTIGREEELLFCKGCLKSALATLNMKADKLPDEIKLLASIRRILKHEIKN